MFIKWDDYFKFLAVAPDECEYPYCFQSFLTDEDGEASASRLRRSDTTGFTRWEDENAGPNYDYGIFIDIFPLFDIPNSPVVRFLQRQIVMFFWRCMRGHDALKQIERGTKPNEHYARFIGIYKIVSHFITPKEIKWAYIRVCAIHGHKAKEDGATSSRIHLPSLMLDASLYRSTVDLPFEGTTICCPVGYEAILDKQYGDRRSPVKGTERHEMVGIDPNIPWREYLACGDDAHDVDY